MIVHSLQCRRVVLIVFPHKGLTGLACGPDADILTRALKFLATVPAGAKEKSP